MTSNANSKSYRSYITIPRIPRIEYYNDNSEPIDVSSVLHKLKSIIQKDRG